jgi:hypothetical protein
LPQWREEKPRAPALARVGEASTVEHCYAGPRVDWQKAR